MIYLQIFLALFIPGILGYGGGPSSIPLIENEVVGRYGWFTVSEFSEILALGNALPGPIATKMAGYIGYSQGGILGTIIAELAVVAPSLVLMILLLKLLFKYKDSPRVKRMSQYVRPTIAVLLGVIAYKFIDTSIGHVGAIQTMVLIGISYLLMERWKIHPSFVILGALVYGSIFLA
ncbi:chromate transporter [Tepidibacillus decaturensis]|uniref:Transporter n=1 Tax=Tepidibacillus decaturensis TaxID=1413211 RepID=A0A135L6T9_9BACI|nr:chromate transporter [Tepidibacillus decaturensis]KXG44617.1 transporter [Tepidibacillus decaturensis]